MLRTNLVRWLRQTISICFFLFFIFTVLVDVDVNAARIPIEVFFTNDLHAQMRPTYDQAHNRPQRLGGLPRLSTLFRSIRARNPSALILDAGDWSDGGSIAHAGLAGTAALRMMEFLKYDAIAVGNHDFITGPNVLLSTFETVRPTTPFLAGNVNTSGYEHALEFKKWVKPYTIKIVNGVKVAILGAVTYEMIYDRFFSPIIITQPWIWTRKLAEWLKETNQADVVIVLSHNSVFLNTWLAKVAPAVDLVIASHDHVLLRKPEVVTGWPRKNLAWVVEAGYWGQYVGQVNLEFDSETRTVTSNAYELIPVNSQWDDDPEALAFVQHAEESVVQMFGEVFSHPVWSSQFEIPKYGFESPAARLETAAVLDATGADIVLESGEFVAAGLSRGENTTADFFGMIPSIYNLKTQKSSMLHVLSIRGRTLYNFLNIFFSISPFSTFGSLSFAGMSFVFDPWLKPTNMVDQRWSITKFFDSLLTTSKVGLISGVTTGVVSGVQTGVIAGVKTGVIAGVQSGTLSVTDVLVNGQPLDMTREYRVAMQDSFVKAIEFVNETFMETVDLTKANKKSIGIEAWRVVEDYVKTHDPEEIEKQVFLPRIRTQRADLTVFQHWIQASNVQQKGEFVRATFTVDVKNFGLSALPDLGDSAMPKARLIIRDPAHIADRYEREIEVGEPKILQPLGPDETQRFIWNDVQLPLEPNRTYAVTVELMGAGGVTTHSGTEITRWFSVDQAVL